MLAQREQQLQAAAAAAARPETGPQLAAMVAGKPCGQLLMASVAPRSCCCQHRQTALLLLLLLLLRLLLPLAALCY
jgi:hypothetical protein